MTFVDAIRTGFTKYAEFRGVAKRSEYWWFFLFSFLVGMVTGTLDSAIWGSSDASYLNIVSSLILFMPMTFQNYFLFIKKNLILD